MTMQMVLLIRSMAKTMSWSAINAIDGSARHVDTFGSVSTLLTVLLEPTVQPKMPADQKKPARAAILSVAGLEPAKLAWLRIGTNSLVLDVLTMFDGSSHPSMSSLHIRQEALP
ncbi:uncharacterized protein MEPE_04852 [Melanopsichium pennsylvanicum]|uniref:Uncharacterized protein n=1 Tax=Melanopsichium pennsylvanicum TaxID=63383 RepID=A0AAJ5C735_9BASI|nr:uncharacterized protein MEPE_04852 [Melanopsichium pennsylvanicum]